MTPEDLKHMYRRGRSRANHKWCEGCKTIREIAHIHWEGDAAWVIASSKTQGSRSKR